jgi:hypothetical protein
MNEFTPEQIQHAEQNPIDFVGRKGFELLHNMPGFLPLYLATRQDALYLDPSKPFQGRKQIILWLAATGSGKKEGIEEMIALSKADAFWQYTLQNQGRKRGVVYLPFSSNALESKKAGEVDQNVGHGQYNEQQYSDISGRMTGNLSRQLNTNGEDDIYVEPSGPTAYLDLVTWEIKGPDRGFSTAVYAAHNYKGIVKALAMDTRRDVRAKIEGLRYIVETSPLQDLPTIFNSAGEVFIGQDGDKIDLSVMDTTQLALFKGDWLDRVAPAMGVKRSHDELKHRMLLTYETRNPEVFWRRMVAEELRLDKDQFWYTKNPFLAGSITSYIGLSEQYDVVMQRMKTASRRQTLLPSREKETLDPQLKAGMYTKMLSVLSAEVQSMILENLTLNPSMKSELKIDMVKNIIDQLTPTELGKVLDNLTTDQVTKTYLHVKKDLS